MFAIPALDRGGPDRVFYELIKYFVRSGTKVLLAVSNTDGFYLRRVPRDVEIIALGASRYPIWQLFRALRRHQPEVLLSTLSMTLTASIAVNPLSGRTLHVPRIANQLSSVFAELQERRVLKSRLARWMTVRALRNAAAVVCQSQDMAVDIRRLVDVQDRTTVVGNPIDEEGLIDGSQTSFPLPGSPALLAVGRLARQKGFDLLVRAMSDVIKHNPQAVLTILGEGEERSALECLIAELSLANHVVLAGRSDAPYGAIRDADALISASRYEGFPNVILESFACETLVIATDCPGATKELVVDGVTGILCRNDGCPQTLGDAIVRALNTSHAELVRNAKAAAKTRYSTRAIGEQYERLLSALGT